MANKANINFYQGDDYTGTLTVYDPNGLPMDLTGYTALAQIRTDVADVASTIVATITTDIQSPLIVISLTHDVTETLKGKYVWDLQVTSPSGSIKTLVAGQITVTQEVTR